MILDKISRNKLLDSNLKLKKLWKMLLLKFVSVVSGNYIVTEINYSRPDIVERLKLLRYEIQIFQPWDGIRWSDFGDLKKILIDKVDALTGDPFESSYRCSSCSSKIDIFKAELELDVHLLVKTINETGTITPSEPCIMLHWQSFKFILYCGFPPCLPDVIKEYNKESKLFKSITKISPKNNDVCDFCHGLTNSAHRCSVCKCKIYCSRDCQINDWNVHKKVCQMYVVIGHKNVKTRDWVVESVNIEEGSCDTVQRVNRNRFKK